MNVRDNAKYFYLYKTVSRSLCHNYGSKYTETSGNTKVGNVCLSFKKL